MGDGPTRVPDASSPGTASPTPALLIGYGNPLRGDDGAGWCVADAVRAAAPASRVRVITVHQLMPELADDVAMAERVLFVDAACDTPAGLVSVRPLSPTDRPPGGFTHHYDPSALLGLAHGVAGRGPGSAWLLTVGVAGLDCGEPLSPPVAAAVPRACTLALELLADVR
jgi:hydrogenase maturation protease